MQSVLVIGAGGVSHVTVHKMASLSKIFTNIILASRTIDKCLKIKKSVKKKYNADITIIELDADNVDETISCLLYTSPSPRDLSTSRMPSSA